MGVDSQIKITASEGISEILDRVYVADLRTQGHVDVSMAGYTKEQIDILGKDDRVITARKFVELRQEQVLAEHRQMLIEQEMAQVKDQARAADTKAEVAMITADNAVKQVDVLTTNMMGRSDCLTALGYARNHGFKIPKAGSKSLAILGRQMCKYLRDHGQDVFTVHDERYGEVKSYSLDVLEKFHKTFQEFHDYHNPVHSFARNGKR